VREAAVASIARLEGQPASSSKPNETEVAHA